MSDIQEGYVTMSVADINKLMNKLMYAHSACVDRLSDAVKGTGWSHGVPYIMEDCWLVKVRKPDGTVIQIDAPIGDVDLLILKVQALI